MRVCGLATLQHLSTPNGPCVSTLLLSSKKLSSPLLFSILVSSEGQRAVPLFARCFSQLTVPFLPNLFSFQSSLLLSLSNSFGAFVNTSPQALPLESFLSLQLGSPLSLSLSYLFSLCLSVSLPPTSLSFSFTPSSISIYELALMGL